MEQLCWQGMGRTRYGEVLWWRSFRRVLQRYLGEQAVPHILLAGKVDNVTTVGTATTNNSPAVSVSVW